MHPDGGGGFGHARLGDRPAPDPHSGIYAHSKRDSLTNFDSDSVDYTVPRSPWKIILLSLSAGLMLSALWTPFLQADANPPEAPFSQYIDPFLYPPYPGTATENSIFDHSSPNYSQSDNRIVAFTGDEGNKACPGTAPTGKAPPQAGVCDAGSGIYWSYSLGDWLSYNGHDGIDFGIQYRPVYAAADSDRVAYAGWADPMDHSYSLGIYVKLHHSNGYNTYYGHMSALAVQSCPTAGCAAISHGDFIGYSGSTGNSTGPHLHFGVSNPAGKSIDPYGWTGESADPWPYDQHNSLWSQIPSVIPYYGSSATVLPTGGIPLAFPPAVINPLVVDDGSAGYTETPAGCWTVIPTTSSQSENGSMRVDQPVISGGATCSARWNFPSGQPAGLYAVYVRIPAIHASSEGALYTVTHTGRSDTVTVNQQVFPNPYHVTDGWLKIGNYDFTAAGNEYVSLSNLTQDTSATYQGRELGVDAVRFIYLKGSVPTNTPGPTDTPTKTFTPSKTWTASKTFTVTKTGTAPPTPTATRTWTSSQTRWPTVPPTNSATLRPTDTHWPTSTKNVTLTPGPSPTRTRTFTPTRTFTRTPIPTRTIRPTDTRWPSLTKTFTKTPGPSPTRTPTRTRTLAPTRWPSATPRPTDTRWPTRTRTPSP
jgi:hypothetical protein